MSGVRSMSELDVTDSVPEHPGMVETGGKTAGQLLRAARESAGLHIAALAVSIKIPVKKLEALEADRLDQLHDAVFVRALASSVCRTLKVDPSSVLEKLPLNATPRLAPDERGINTPFRTPGEVTGASIPTWLSRPPVLIVGALLAAAAGVVFFPDIQFVEPAAESSNVTKTEPAAPFAAASMEVTSVAPQPEESRESQPAMVPASHAVVVTTMSMASSQPAPAVVAPAQLTSAAVATVTLPTTGIVVFRARAATWVKVVDAKGVVQLSKTLAEGETVGASGATPLSVVVGRVDMTDVEVRGQAFNLTGVARENVARFEVK